MDENGTSPMSDLEREFSDEQKGEGSLTISIASGDGKTPVGWDLNPEDIEALYFDGIGVPRWEHLQADTVEQQTAMYWERFNEKMSQYPLIGRVRDTDERVEYSSAEAGELALECERVTAGTDNTKALRAVQKISIAAGKAVNANASMLLAPSQLPEFG